MTFDAFIGAVELGLIYGLVALGLFISYRILDLADLTVDGSFTLGAVASVMITLTGHPWLGILSAVLVGCAAGFVTAFLQTKLKIQSILAGILTMTALYSINIKLMNNKANVNLIGKDTVFSFFSKAMPNGGKLLLITIFVTSAVALTVMFLRTQIGLAIRATGDNEAMVRSSSINSDLTKTIGLVFANALVGLSGGLLAQYQQFSDANMGIGVVVIGLASLIIGEVLAGNLIYLIFRRRNMLTGAVSVIIGGIVYRIIIAFVLRHSGSGALSFLNITASDMKLLSSVIVVIAISYPVVRDRLRLYRQKRRSKNAAN